MALQTNPPHGENTNTAALKDWCHTKRESKTFQFVWSIEKYLSSCQKEGEFLESSIFPVDYDAPKWKLRLYPKGIGTGYGYVSFCLVLHCGSDIAAEAQFYVISDKNELIKKNKIDTTTFVAQKPIHGGKFLDFDELSTPGLLPHGTLTIHCEVVVLGKIYNISGYMQPIDPINTLSEDLEKLYDCEQFSDVTLIADGHELKAHKTILSARSKVFAAMFHQPMKEQISDRVTITDVQPEVLKEMLRFLYTDKVAALDAMAKELFVVADKYDIINLKTLCANSLIANVTVENAVSTLIIADRHNAKELKSTILRFITRNAKEVTLTDGWNDMKSSDTQYIEVVWAILDGLELKHE